MHKIDTGRAVFLNPYNQETTVYKLCESSQITVRFAKEQGMTDVLEQALDLLAVRYGRPLSDNELDCWLSDRAVDLIVSLHKCDTVRDFTSPDILSNT